MRARILRRLVHVVPMLVIGNYVALAGQLEDAKNGNTTAQNNLGVAYAYGQGVPKDEKEAVKWFRRAAAQGDAHGEANLGAMYQHGRGVPLDFKEAFKWYRLAAVKGDAFGQASLGAMYANGQGVAQDNQEAVKWLRLAAAQGEPIGLSGLGLMYAYGRGVQRDYVRAYMWLTLGVDARAGRDPRGRECQGNCGDNLAQVSAEMTTADISRAQEMGKFCAQSNYRRCGEPEVPQLEASTTSVPMRLEGGTYVVPVLINDTITLNFVVDSGAADVSIPADVVMTLMRTGTLTKADFLGQQIYVLADGSKVPSQTFRIRSLKVGNKVLGDVDGSVASVQGGLLLGQSFLSRFKSWSVDNIKHALIFE